MDLEVDAELGEIRDRLEDARLRRHRHEVANALTAVEGAYLLLTRETLQASERSTLTEILGSGLGQLRELVLVDPPVERARLYEIATSTAGEWGGADHVEVDVAPDLEVAGSPGEVCEILRRLLIHAFGRTGGRPVSVRGCRCGPRVELWVDGGGRPAGRERHLIRATDRSGLLDPSTTGVLRVVVRLARGQRADVLRQARPDGAVSIGVSWPVPGA